jgi:hypothetical protein
MTDRSFEARNDASRERLRTLAATLTPADLDRDAGEGWTVGALLAHAAFWDSMVARRWSGAIAAGLASPVGIPDFMADLINDAELPTWREMDGRTAADRAIEAADAVDRLVAGLPDTAVDAAVAAGLPRVLDRSLHRNDHFGVIDRALGSGGTATPRA